MDSVKRLDGLLYFDSNDRHIYFGIYGTPDFKSPPTQKSDFSGKIKTPN